MQHHEPLHLGRNRPTQIASHKVQSRQISQFTPGSEGQNMFLALVPHMPTIRSRRQVPYAQLGGNDPT
jgi:hypothetical protein